MSTFEFTSKPLALGSSTVSVYDGLTPLPNRPSTITMYPMIANPTSMNRPTRSSRVWPRLSEEVAI